MNEVTNIDAAIENERNAPTAELQVLIDNDRADLARYEEALTRIRAAQTSLLEQIEADRLRVVEQNMKVIENMQREIARENDRAEGKRTTIMDRTNTEREALLKLISAKRKALQELTT